MRPKLVFGVSLIAALVGAGSCIAIVFGVFSSFNPISNPGFLIVATLVFPLAAIIFSSVFVYRHTARRRKLQALMTAMLATLLILALLVVATILSARRNPERPPVIQPLTAS